MKKLHLMLLLFGVFACRRDQEPEPEDFGFLSATISVEITEEEANARTESVNTDDFVLIIYDAGDNVILTFDPFSTAPSEVQLPVGEYYVVANSNDLVEAGFDNPYYFGRSANFTIDKEEVKTVDIIATLANAKVAINYSAGVVNTFDIYEGIVTVTGSGTQLTYVTGETREGYFVTTSPLDVEVSLVYNKLDGTTIERSLIATISNPQPKTLYNINVDATLEDGNIIFNLTVDESFDTVNIDLGAVNDPTSGTFIDARDGQEYGFVTIGNQVWMSENLNYDTIGSYAYDDTQLNETYGRLYNWPSLMNYQTGSNENPSGVKGICPSGWHVPSDVEWQELEYFLGMDSADNEIISNWTRAVSARIGERLKSTSNLWSSLSVATDEYGFSVLPSGNYSGNVPNNIGSWAFFWTSTSEFSGAATGRIFGSGEGLGRQTAYSADDDPMANAFSCRCVRD